MCSLLCGFVDFISRFVFDAFFYHSQTDHQTIPQAVFLSSLARRNARKRLNPPPPLWGTTACRTPTQDPPNSFLQSLARGYSKFLCQILQILRFLRFLNPLYPPTDPALSAGTLKTLPFGPPSRSFFNFWTLPSDIEKSTFFRMH